MKRINECQINLSLIGKKSTERPLLWPWTSAASFKKKTDWLEIWFIFFLFSDRQGCHFPHKGIAVNRNNRRNSDKSTFNFQNIVKWLNTLHLGPAVVKLAEIRHCAASAHTQPPSPPLPARLTSCWWVWLLQRSDAVSLSIAATLNCWEASQKICRWGSA